MNLLLERECCVCEVMQALEISQSRASRGLSALSDTGFLKMKKEGLWSLYSIDKESLSDYQCKLMEAVKEAMKDSAIAVIDKERLKQARRVGVKCLKNAGYASQNNKEKD